MFIVPVCPCLSLFVPGCFAGAGTRDGFQSRLCGFGPGKRDPQQAWLVGTDTIGIDKRKGRQAFCTPVHARLSVGLLHDLIIFGLRLADSRPDLFLQLTGGIRVCHDVAAAHQLAIDP